MKTDTPVQSVATVSSDVGDAVGVPDGDRFWFIAIVKHNTEKASAEKLLKAGYQCYVPIQEEIRIWRNGKRAKIDRVVIPAVIFVYCTDAERKEMIKFPFLLRYMTNPAGGNLQHGHKPLAIIPAEQIQKLRFMLGNAESPVCFGQAIFQIGDLVRVIRGKLSGLVGEVHVIDKKRSRLFVRLNCLGSASLEIDNANVEPVN